MGIGQSYTKGFLSSKKPKRSLMPMANKLIDIVAKKKAENKAKSGLMRVSGGWGKKDKDPDEPSN